MTSPMRFFATPSGFTIERVLSNLRTSIGFIISVLFFVGV
jgi:hypothetical protein